MDEGQGITHTQIGFTTHQDFRGLMDIFWNCTDPVEEVTHYIISPLYGIMIFWKTPKENPFGLEPLMAFPPSLTKSEMIDFLWGLHGDHPGVVEDYSEVPDGQGKTSIRKTPVG